MTNYLSLSAIALALSVTAVADANAWSRNATVSGPYRSATVHGSGSCYNGVCTRQITRTGPNGYSATRSGSVYCDPNTGSCSGHSTVTGPYGGTINRQGTVSR